MKLPFAGMAAIAACLSLVRPAAAVALTFEERPETEIDFVTSLSSHGYMFGAAHIVGLVGDPLGRFTENGGKWLASLITIVENFTSTSFALRSVRDTLRLSMASLVVEVRGLALKRATVRNYFSRPIIPTP